MLVKASEESLQQHLAATPSVVTHELVQQILAYEQKSKMGYFPALEFLIQHNTLDPDLVNALQNIIWVVSNLVNNEIKQKLRPVFSTVRLDSLQPVAFGLSNVMVNDINRQDKLLQFYDLTRIRVNLTVTMVQKNKQDEAAQEMARSLAYRWLQSSFERIEVTSSTVVA